MIECTKLVNAVQGRSVHEIFGSPDNLKFRSSMTLFAACSAEPAVFSDAIARYFEGIPDPLTLELLSER